MSNEIHPSKDVQLALQLLNDALCTWERATGLMSVLILKEQGGWTHRSIGGKPNIPDDVEDTQLLKSLT